MNEWLDFFAAIVDSLAWPVAIALTVYILRRELRELIPRLRHFRVGNVNVDFAEKLEKLEEEAGEVDLPPPFEPTAPGPPTFDEDQLLTATSFSPRGTVLDSWVLLEDELRNAAGRVGVVLRQYPSTAWLVRELQEGEHIRPELRAIIEDLRVLRNAAVHDRDFDLSAELAYEYSTLTRRMGAALALLGDDPPSANS